MDHRMLASDPIIVVDLYKRLPPDGETCVSYIYDGSRLSVEIQFDDPADASINRKVNLVFTGVVSMYVSSVPGVNTLNLEYTGPQSSRGVVEFVKSEAAESWSEHFGWKLRHFSVHFAYENELLVVFAKDCVIE